MSAVDVSIKTNEAAPAAPAPHPRRFSLAGEAWHLFAKLFLSRQVYGTFIALWYLWADHWADIACISGLKDPAQIQAVVSLSQNKNDTMKWVLLGFLGFSTAGNMMGSVGSSVVNRFTQTTMQRTPAPGGVNRNTRADRE